MYNSSPGPLAEAVFPTRAKWEGEYKDKPGEGKIEIKVGKYIFYVCVADTCGYSRNFVQNYFVD